MANILSKFISLAMMQFEKSLVRLFVAVVKADKEDMPSDFESHVFVARVTGLWPTANDPQWYKWLTIAFFIFVGILLPIFLGVNLLLVTCTEDIIKYSFEVLFCVATTLKAGIIYYRRANIRDLFRTHATLTRATSINTRHIDRMSHLSTRVHVGLASLYVGSWCMALVQSLVVQPEDAQWQSTTHLPYEFAQRRTVYWMGFAYEILASLAIMIWSAMEDSFYVALINMNCGHVIELKKRLIQLGAVDNDDLMFHIKLVECCKQYEGCLR